MPDTDTESDTTTATTTEIIPDAIAILRATPAVLRALLAGIPAETRARPNPQGWSIKDVVAHIHDTEGIAFTERIRSILDEDEPAVAAIDPPARLEAGGYAARTLDDLLDDLARLRPQHVAWIATLTPDQLMRTGRHNVAGPISPRDIIHQWAYHDLNHLRQIMEMLQAELAPHMGRTRAFYPESERLLSWHI
jgi:DinB superfamily